MTYIKELTISLCDWETRIILESVSREASRLKSICEHSEDEDEAADAGNDYLELIGLKERLENHAIELFGQQITDFSRDAL
ncbi:hypothetical protein CYL31_13155 [Marinomonas sp. A3A]|jgi:hypothetical protein|uniref:hypothetical protein n=1 Tax=Marinomonas sp. A3A TaxID=2065312 RepID=UPI001BB4391E|nr:hypothetical protein [Marinomonas sp. A3A]QUX92290.1 hypothetical protein CYL31_13155 [Marinomonas sp. A3A]